MLRYLRLYRTIIRTFGFRVRPIFTFLLKQIHRLISGGTRGLDHVVYPGFKKRKLDRPIFILGNPRSGTTFVHRFLLNSQRLCAFELWEMLLPAITARRMFGGVLKALAPFNPARYHSSEAHETSLRDIETDDVAWFMHAVDGPFLWAYFHAWEDTWGSEQSKRAMDLGYDTATRERLFRYMEGCWRRNMHAKDRDRIICKTSVLSSQAAYLLERYPDAKLLYLVRDPMSTIPSGMSLLTGVLEGAYDIWRGTSAEARERYLENLYQASCSWYRSYHELVQSGAIRPEQHLVVPYPSLLADLEGTMTRIAEFTELDPVPEFWDKLKAQAEKQKTRKSGHKYSLEKFGLTEERIRKDLAFVYDNYEVE